jgi:ubiquinone/menaquinone biosynthesis C-methylase UbiE
MKKSLIRPSKRNVEIGNKKIKEKNLDDKIELIVGDSENMPFPDNHFDAITAFLWN